MLPNTARQQQEPPDSPSFREFTAERYDYARMIALLELIAANVSRVDTGSQPFVPIPAVLRIEDARTDEELMSLVAVITGQEV